MREVVGGLALLAGLGVLLHINLGQRDRRFKTGYKNNQVPTQMAMGPRLKWTAGLWTVGGLCLADPSVLAFLAAAAGAVAGGFTTWKLYPQFWSRFQRSATSNAAFITARLSMSTAIGGTVAYVIAQGFGGGLPSVATTPQVSSPPAASAKSVSRSPPTAPAPVEEIIQASRSTVAPTVMPVEVKGALPPDNQGQMPPVRPVEVEAMRAPVTRQGSPSNSMDDADDESEDGDRSPRDLRALGPIRGLTGARSGSAPFDRRFPYTPPAQQRSADPENSYPTAQRDPATSRQVCNAVYRDHPFESGRGMLMLERAVGAIPDVVEKRVNDVLDTTRFFGRAPWDELLELASTQVLLGTFFCSTRQYGSSNRYLDLLNNDLDEYLPEHRKRTLQQKLDQARWRELWSPGQRLGCAPRPASFD